MWQRDMETTAGKNSSSWGAAGSPGSPARRPVMARSAGRGCGGGDPEGGKYAHTQLTPRGSAGTEAALSDSVPQ